MDRHIFTEAFSAAGSPLYFCSVCAKPFDQETSRTRHLQYCRRRGERNQSSRPRACHSCRRTKSKCDFARPCSRCAGKGLECSYGTYRSATTSGPVTFNATIPRSSSGVGTPGLITGISPRIFNDASIHPSLMTQEDDAGFILPLDSYGANAVDSSRDNTRPALGDNMLSTATLPSDEEISSLPLLSSPTLDGINAFLFAEEGPPHALISSTPLAARDPHDAPTDVLSLVPVPDRTIGVPPRPCSRRISKGCRRFILSIIRTYPSMMAASGNLPPYVHPVGCGLHFDGQDPGLRSAETAVFAPLKPLAACYGIAQVFASRVPNTSEFLWRAVEKEHSLIRDEMHQYSLGEMLAATQAMTIYTTMRVIDSGRDYFIVNRDMINTMAKLGIRFGHLCQGPASAPHRRESRPHWEEWIFEETRRRISIVCFIMALVLGSEDSPSLSAPLRLPLPSSKALWGANSRCEWERAYAISLGQPFGCEVRLETVGDLAVAQMRRDGADDEGSQGSPGKVGGDALDCWLASADGLGMMLAAVIADS